MDKGRTLKTPLAPDLRRYVASARRTGATEQARRASHFRVVRPSMGTKSGRGAWSLSRGDRLDGVLIEHPVNAARKVIVRTAQGTFTINEEDLEEV